jgi:predicted nucleic acid-binding protein
MNEYIVDANVLFSALIRQKELYDRLLEQCIFYTPDFALAEIQRYRKIILKKTRQNPEQLRVFTIRFFEKLVILPDFLISDEALETAVTLCADIDPKDAVYIALAQEMGLPLITRDKMLIEGLQSKGFTLVKPFDELVRDLLG